MPYCTVYPGLQITGKQCCYKNNTGPFKSARTGENKFLVPHLSRSKLGRISFRTSTTYAIFYFIFLGSEYFSLNFPKDYSTCKNFRIRLEFSGNISFHLYFGDFHKDYVAQNNQTWLKNYILTCNKYYLHSMSPTNCSQYAVMLINLQSSLKVIEYICYPTEIIQYTPSSHRGARMPLQQNNHRSSSIEECLWLASGRTALRISVFSNHIAVSTL